MEDKIKVLRVSNYRDILTMEAIMIGRKPRHFAKYLTGVYDVSELETGSLQAASLMGNSVTWIGNGDDAYPKDPRRDWWTLPGLDYRVWGVGLIYGVSKCERTHTAIGTQELSDLLMRGQMTQRRTSAIVDAVTGLPLRTSPGLAAP